jgi:integrase
VECEQCTGDRAHLRAVLIIAADTGLRRNELFTLSWKENDIDFANRQIRLREINAKWNKGRTIPMTQRVYEELLKLKKEYGDLVLQCRMGQVNARGRCHNSL